MVKIKCVYGGDGSVLRHFRYLSSLNSSDYKLPITRFVPCTTYARERVFNSYLTEYSAIDGN